MRQKRIRRFAGVLMVLLGLWTVYYLYDFVWGLFEVRFFDLDHLPNAYGLDASQVDIATRHAVFLAWLPSILLGLLGFIFGIIGAFNVYQGRIFDPSALWPVVGIGGVTCISVVAGTLAYNFELDVMWPLTDNAPLPREWVWSQVEVTIFFFGLGFILLGFLQIEATKILQENKEFI